MTRDEFEQGYAERSGVTVEWLYEHNQFGIPCDCEADNCEGWQMATLHSDGECQHDTKLEIVVDGVSLA